MFTLSTPAALRRFAIVTLAAASLLGTAMPSHAAPSRRVAESACMVQNPRTAPVKNPHSKLERYFPQTGHTVYGAFLTYYNKTLKPYGGGLTILGYPLTEAFCEVDPRAIGNPPDWAQYFERGRLYLSGGTAHLTELGYLSYTGVTFDTQALAQMSAFTAGPYTVAPIFQDYYDRHGGDEILGDAISSEFQETNGDGTGNTYWVQYFQCGRIESHPENVNTPYEIELGQIGRQYLQATNVM